ncbi:PAS-domain containing protein [Phaeobacter sp. B1627]|uniref:hybrid sensor histidine kinase/response regulator n=1 Tax=Phaeobacter sp. B1627 TaxID=2583809 RepID=UPI0021062479|nr:PAS-domain containing protein [Phaeobacter sp. B1627]
MKTRDLEAAANELESLRYEQQRTRANLDNALEAMEGGFALFTDNHFVVCNELFRQLLPDISQALTPSLTLSRYLDLMAASKTLVSTNRHSGQSDTRTPNGMPVLSIVLELTEDRWFQMRVQPMREDRVVLMMTEITSIVRQNRNEKESLIGAQAVYLQAVFENMTSGVCSFSASGTVIMFNAAFRELLGLPGTAIKWGMPLSQILSTLRSSALVGPYTLRQLKDWRDAMAAGRAFRMRVEHPKGQVLDLQANPLPDGGFLVELKDVTLQSRVTATLEKRVAERTAELTRANERLTGQYETQARVEEELRLAKEQAEAAVSSKTRFLAAASHDLLQPVNASRLMLETVVQSSQNTPIHDSVKRLQRAFRSTEQLLQALLDISRLESAAPDTITHAEVGLRSLMQGVFDDQLAVANQKNVDLRVVPSSLYVRSDPVYLLRSLQNLVVNAIQYNHSGGRVLVGCRRKGDKAILQVWDSGIGISPADQTRIFDEFTRAESSASVTGVGIGLSVVERACRHLGHRLWVHSTPGKGSLFCIEMTCVPGDQVQTDPENPAPPQNGQPLDLIAMVIENDEDVLFATTRILEQWGADVLPVSSVEEGLKHLRDMGMPPDILLVDYHLDHGATGVQAIAEIRAHSGTFVPAILITANRSEDLVILGRERGFSVMTKPVQPSRLRPLIEWKARASMGGQSPLA